MPKESIEKQKIFDRISTLFVNSTITPKELKEVVEICEAAYTAGREFQFKQDLEAYKNNEALTTKHE